MIIRFIFFYILSLTLVLNEEIFLDKNEQLNKLNSIYTNNSKNYEKLGNSQKKILNNKLINENSTFTNSIKKINQSTSKEAKKNFNSLEKIGKFSPQKVDDKKNKSEFLIYRSYYTKLNEYLKKNEKFDLLNESLKSTSQVKKKNLNNFDEKFLKTKTQKNQRIKKNLSSKDNAYSKVENKLKLRINNDKKIGDFNKNEEYLKQKLNDKQNLRRKRENQKSFKEINSEKEIQNIKKEELSLNNSKNSFFENKTPSPPLNKNLNPKKNIFDIKSILDDNVNSEYDKKKDSIKENDPFKYTPQDNFKNKFFSKPIGSKEKNSSNLIKSTNPYIFTEKVKTTSSLFEAKKTQLFSVDIKENVDQTTTYNYEDVKNTKKTLDFTKKTSKFDSTPTLLYKLTKGFFNKTQATASSDSTKKSDKYIKNKSELYTTLPYKTNENEIITDSSITYVMEDEVKTQNLNDYISRITEKPYFATKREIIESSKNTDISFSTKEIENQTDSFDEMNSKSSLIFDLTNKTSKLNTTPLSKTTKNPSSFLKTTDFSSGSTKQKNTTVNLTDKTPSFNLTSSFKSTNILFNISKTTSSSFSTANIKDKTLEPKTDSFMNNTAHLFITTKNPFNFSKTANFYSSTAKDKNKTISFKNTTTSFNITSLFETTKTPFNTSKTKTFHLSSTIDINKNFNSQNMTTRYNTNVPFKTTENPFNISKTTSSYPTTAKSKNKTLERSTNSSKIDTTPLFRTTKTPFNVSKTPIFHLSSTENFDSENMTTRYNTEMPFKTTENSFNISKTTSSYPTTAKSKNKTLERSTNSSKIDTTPLFRTTKTPFNVSKTPIFHLSSTENFDSENMTTRYNTEMPFKTTENPFNISKTTSSYLTTAKGKNKTLEHSTNLSKIITTPFFSTTESLVNISKTISTATDFTNKTSRFTTTPHFISTKNLHIIPKTTALHSSTFKDISETLNTIFDKPRLTTSQSKTTKNTFHSLKTTRSDLSTARIKDETSIFKKNISNFISTLGSTLPFKTTKNPNNVFKTTFSRISTIKNKKDFSSATQRNELLNSCSQFDGNCQSCLSKNYCLYVLENKQCLSLENEPKCDKNKLIFLFNYFQENICKLKLPLTQKNKLNENYSLLDVSTHNCLMSNASTIVFAFFVLAVIIIAFIFIFCEICQLCKRKKKSSFSVVKRTSVIGSKDWIMEMNIMKPSKSQLSNESYKYKIYKKKNDKRSEIDFSKKKNDLKNVSKDSLPKIKFKSNFK